MNVYAIFDKKVAAYGQPFFATNDEVARRMVSGATQDRNSLLATFPEDYQLEHIGEWDETTGTLGPSKPSVIAPVSALVWLEAAPFSFPNGSDPDEEGKLTA